MKVLVVSNMYPSDSFPSYGIFVKHFCEQLELIDVHYSLSIMKKASNKFKKMWNYLSFYVGTFFKCLFIRYDIVYVHYASHSGLPVLLANKFKKLNIFTNLHGSDVVPENETQEKMQIITEKLVRISKKIIVPSEYFKKYVADKYNIDMLMICITPSGGIDSNVFYKEKDKNFSNELKLGYVGRISHDKGWDTLLKACSCLKIEYELYLVGNGPEKDDMLKMVDELNINNSIHFLDLQPQNKLREIYNEIDVFIFPTEREGESLGLVALEAMACGTPVIASDFAAPSYYVCDDINGYKFEVKNYKDLASKIQRFAMLDISDREKLGQGAMHTAEAFNKLEALESIRTIVKG